ncbi:MAG: type 1 glutamine amidotransferase [Rhizobiaceae bacterium]
MNVLIVQNFESTGLGQVCTALKEAGAERDYRKPYFGEALPQDCSQHDAIVVLGGGQSAVDDHIHPYLPHLAALMRDFADSGKAALGICLGSQILARGYGATNLIGKAPEFGWQRIALTDEGKSDPVLGAVPGQFPIFQWHDDTFTLPQGAVRLASNDATPNQAFRVGRAGYGIQFHFEADRPLVEKWNARFPDDIARKDPDWFDKYPAHAQEHGPHADAAGLAIARAWVKQIHPMRKAA